MSAAALKESPPAPLSLPALLETLAALEVEWRPRGEAVAVRDPFHVLTGELKGAIAEHRPALLRLAGHRAECRRLHEYALNLRCGDHDRDRHARGLAYLARQIERFASTCRVLDDDGCPVGYDDPEDPFSVDAVAALREEHAELTAPGNPYPLGPLGDNPVAEGRRYNGRPL